MQLVFGHVWALWWWRQTHTRTTANDLRTNKTLDPLVDTAPDLKRAGVLDLMQEGLAHGFPHDIAMDLLVRPGGRRTQLDNVKFHHWSGHVPTGALCSAGQQLVTSPEFTYVLVAERIQHICKERLDRRQFIIVLAELGCELCGTYSKQTTPRGFNNRQNQLVNTAQMRDFACDISHDRGAALAYDALRWVIDGLNSPMETALYLMLCLPCTFGGIACIRPQSNVPLPIPPELRRKTNRQLVIPDLYWREFNMAAEFFGSEPHDGRERDDYERRELEQEMGLTVVTFWKEDMLDLARFNSKAEIIARHLGISMPKLDDKFTALQQQLINMLIKHQRWV